MSGWVGVVCVCVCVCGDRRVVFGSVGGWVEVSIHVPSRVCIAHGCQRGVCQRHSGLAVRTVLFSEDGE